MAVIKHLCSDAGNGLHTACHRDTGRMAAIQPFQKICINLPVGIVLNHADFLADDPLLLGHALFCKIWHRNKREQNAQTLLKMFRSSKIIAGDRVAGKSVRLSPQLGQLLQRVAVFRVEHFMLKIMGHACRRFLPFPVQAKAHIHTAVVCSEKSVILGKSTFGYHKQPQAVVACLAEYPLLQFRIVCLFHSTPSFSSGFCAAPRKLRRKYTVSSRMPAAASSMRSRVTASRSAARLSTVSVVPVTA